MLPPYSETDNQSSDSELKWFDQSKARSQLESLPTDQHLVVDFDETLFLCNSSQEFIRTAKPYLLGAILYKALELLRPWAWFGDQRKANLTRDWFHVMAVTIFFPWTWFVWNYNAKKMAKAWTNQTIAKVLKKRDSKYLILSSQGFGPIVRPVLKHMGIKFSKINTCRLLFGYTDRLRCKVDRVKDLIGNSALRDSAVITDSLEDSALLDYSKTPLLFKWPPSPVVSITSHYIPFFYLYKVKHEGIAPILRDIVSVDLLLLFITLSWINPLPWIHCVGLSFFFLSLWTIYEVGYMENDEVAYNLEEDPILGKLFEKKRDLISYTGPWIWATIFTFIGAGIFQQIQYLDTNGISALTFITDKSIFIDSFAPSFFTAAQLTITATWMVVLVAMRLVYKFYNYTDKMTRTWVYPLLQAFKTIGFLVICSVNLVGAIALASQLISRSFGYFLYRWGRRDWPGSEGHFLRFLIFPTSLALIAYALGGDYAQFLTLQTLVIALWITSKALKPALHIIKNIKHVSNDDWKKLD